MRSGSYTELLDRFYDSPLRIGVYLLVFITLPSVTTIGLATEVLIFGLFALAFNLVFGFAGLLSFGHALFLGVGAYAAALLTIHLGWPVLAILVVVIVLQILLGLIVGGLSLRLSGIYFAIITLAFAQFFYELSFTFSSITGGSDGLIGIFRPSMFGLDMVTVGDSVSYYVFVVVIMTLVVVFVYALSRSTFGRTLQAIKENEERTEALGVDTYRVKLVTFTISSVIAGIAGALWAMYIRFLSPNIFYWTFSGDAVLYTLIGGMNSLFGPIAGAFALFAIEQNLFSTQPGLLNLTIGGLFIFFVMLARSGIVGILETAAYRLAGWADGQSENADSEAAGSRDES
jgi:branched-chain amino acid transport system permease protein